MTKTAEPRI